MKRGRISGVSDSNVKKRKKETEDIQVLDSGSMKSHSKYVIDTCNGLLCLSIPSDEYGLGPPIVCNPVTGEYINLPKPKMIIDFKSESMGYNFIYGFGFSPATKQYKVIRVSSRNSKIPLGNKVDVHILGTKTWNHIGYSDHALPMLSPAYLNGFLYWCNGLLPLRISSFDVENERFGSVPAPEVNQPFRYYSVGVLGAEFCISMVLNSADIHVWTMKDDGVGNAWSKVFSSDHKYYTPTTYYGSFHPIKYLNDGALLMFYSSDDSLVYMDPKENRLRYLKVCQFMTHEYNRK